MRGCQLTTQEFIDRAKEVHGDKYDYSKANYTRMKDKVCIICPTHGEFWQKAYFHLAGKGCRYCVTNTYKKVLFGFGYYDTNDCFNNNYNRKIYETWQSMIERCYANNDKWVSYIGCSVCEEWRYYSNFKVWYDKKYINGWALDKDILIKGNKVYSPSSCCFVPQEINNLTVKQQKEKRGNTIGVFKVKNKNIYISHLSKYGKNVYLGSFNSELDAFNAYKKAKEEYIKEVADKWKDKIEPRVYEALYNYQVEITD